MPKISAVGLFCLDEFENNQTRTCTTFFRTSKKTEVYFKISQKLQRSSEELYYILNVSVILRYLNIHIFPTNWNIHNYIYINFFYLLKITTYIF